ncbi:MAG TPA: hypothetical protein VK804_28685 [Bradyrhizobium sp.]|jgi:hypothetical protein|uniref:hypothetical protein n=1 Tax=Bradyrhizobium sp. TaxID=376 RepID=UPI002C46087E|nr:hypothetical protein [Bradyrhizobium sp.]HTB04463.1 hypothetical protein [Bradyrhizobium sp.]
MSVFSGLTDPPKGAQIGLVINDRNAATVKLITIAFWYSLAQLAVSLGAYFWLSTNLEASRLIHSTFQGLDGLTPALERLKVFYHSPVSGREFSQAFAIYFVLLAWLCFNTTALVVLSVTNVFAFGWKRLAAPVYWILFAMFGLAVWGDYSFFYGPSVSLEHYHGMFGSDFIRAVCILQPIGQFLLFFAFASAWGVGGIRETNSPVEIDHES